MVWVVLLGLLVLIIMILYWRSEKRNSFAKHLPLLNPAYPLVGNGLILLGKSEDERFWGLRSMTSPKHKLTRFYLGTQLVIGTTDPEIAQQILTDPVWMEKPFLYEFFELPFGLVTSKYDIWKAHRKVLNPAFNLKILQSFIPIFKTYSQKLVDKLATHPEGASINIVEDVTICSLQLVLQTTFGWNCEAIAGFESLGEKIERFFFLVSKRVMNVGHYVDLIYRLSADGRENKQLRQELDQWAELILRDVARRYHESNPEIVDKDEHYRKPKIFVDELYTNKMVEFTQKEIADEAFTLVGAGTDTSSNTVAFCLLSLGMYPEIQQKVYDEVMQVFPSEDTEFTSESLKQLEYLEMVIRETLRLFPVGPMIVRQSMAASTVDGFHIPKGNVVAFDIFNMHRRKDLYGDDADSFNPDRFSPERSKDRNPFAFLAFSGGSRGCIGVRYAMMSMKIMIVHMVKAYVIKSDLRHEDLRFKFDIILRLQNGYFIQLKKRTGKPC